MRWSTLSSRVLTEYSLRLLILSGGGERLESAFDLPK
jgi:hypothetical protein